MTHTVLCNMLGTFTNTSDVHEHWVCRGSLTSRDGFVTVSMQRERTSSSWLALLRLVGNHNNALASKPDIRAGVLSFVGPRFC